MKEETSLALTHDLFQLLVQFPRLKFGPSAMDGLTQREYELLVMLFMNLHEDRRAFSVTELSNLLQITPAGVTHLINPLEAAGCVERLPSPTDRRVVLIGVTGKGTQVAESLIAEIQEQLTGLVSHLGEEDSRTLIRVMSKSMAFFAPHFQR